MLLTSFTSPNVLFAMGVDKNVLAYFLMLLINEETEVLYIEGILLEKYVDKLLTTI